MFPFRSFFSPSVFTQPFFNYFQGSNNPQQILPMRQVLPIMQYQSSHYPWQYQNIPQLPIMQDLPIPLYQPSTYQWQYGATNNLQQMPIWQQTNQFQPQQYHTQSQPYPSQPQQYPQKLPFSSAPAIYPNCNQPFSLNPNNYPYPPLKPKSSFDDIETIPPELRNHIHEMAEINILETTSPMNQITKYFYDNIFIKPNSLYIFVEGCDYPLIEKSLFRQQSEILFVSRENIFNGSYRFVNYSKEFSKFNQPKSIGDNNVPSTKVNNKKVKFNEYPDVRFFYTDTQTSSLR